MINVRELWKRRLTSYFHDVRRHLRYMMNDHLLLVLLIGVGAGAVVYKQWVESLPPHFPFTVIIALAFAPFLTHSPVQTLLREADLVFLLPVEKKLGPYFQRAAAFSLMLQIYLLLLVVAAVSPLYKKFLGHSLGSLFIVLLGLKIWNMFIAWKGNYFVERSINRFSWGVRFALNFLFLYFVLAKAHIVFLGSLIVVMILLVVYFSKTTKRKGLKWEQLISQDTKRLMTFYRLANLFTDVPQLKDQVKRRRWLDVFLPLVSYRQENTYLYLFVRAFLRAGDYFGLYVRLTIIACFIIYIVPTDYGKCIALIFFIFATGFQLSTLSRHYETKLTVQLYPIAKEQKGTALFRFLFTLLSVQTGILSLFMLLISNMLLSTLSLAGGILFSYIFLSTYAIKRWS